MYCPECGKDNESTAEFCIHCGKKLPALAFHGATPNTENVLDTHDGIPQIRPWVRFFARLLDIYIVYLLAVVLFAIMGGIIYDLAGSKAVDTISSMPGWLDILITTMFTFFLLFLIEPGFISKYGSTPGKWILKTKVKNPDGSNLTFKEAYSRSFQVYTRGFLIGIPFLNFISLLIESTKLEKEGKTTWDEKGGFVVEHERIGPLRIILAVIVLVLIRVFQMYLTRMTTEL